MVFAFFGYNESYGGKEGLEKYKADLAAFIKNAQTKKYNGKSAGRVVIFSPIAHEDLTRKTLKSPNPNMPTGAENNARLEMYSAAMQEVAEANGAVFVDIFHPSQKLYAESDVPSRSTASTSPKRATRSSPT